MTGLHEGASFADSLRRLRALRSLTQEELAERAGLTVKAIGALERGERRRPYPHTVRSLADALQLDDDERATLVASVPRREAAPVTAPAAAPAGATAPVGALLGRDGELEALVALLRGSGRLVTLTGPGGVGKTRLALEAVARLRDTFSAGATVVALADERDPDAVLGRIAAALGVPEAAAGHTVGGLAPYLAGRRALVALDNLEHLLAAAPVVAELVTRCPDLVILVTSRAPLRVRAEQVVELPPLDLPRDDRVESVRASSAVAMFLDRTAAAGVPLSVGPDNAAALAAVCRRLDGLPLALELAAAAGRLLGPDALLARLDGLGTDAGLRDLPDRQRTMSATLDWSHDLLEPGAQRLFAQLAVLVGGFSLEAVEVVPDVPDPVSALSVLVDQSLVTRVPGGPRFRLLEPVRRYAEQRLRTSGEAPAISDRHAAHFHARALAARAGLRGGSLPEALDRLEPDHANLRTAYLRLVDTDRPGDAAGAAWSIWLYLALRGHAREGIAWLERLDHLQLTDLQQSRARTAAAGLCFVSGNIPRMREHALRALALARVVHDDPLRAEAAVLAGYAAIFSGDPDPARALTDEGLAAAESADDHWTTVLGLVAHGQLGLLGGDLDAAGLRLVDAEQRARRLGNAFALASALNRRATVTELTGDHRLTAALLGESIELSVGARMSWTLGYALPALAGVAVRLGEVEAAALLFGATASLSVTQAVDPRFPVARALHDRDLATVRERLGEESFRQAWDAGRAADLGEISALSAELGLLARG